MAQNKSAGEKFTSKEINTFFENMKDFEDTLTNSIKWAEKSDLPELINEIQKNPAAVFERDEKGNTPLHYATQKEGFEPLVIAIINSGAEIEAYNNNNQTPADLAVSEDVRLGLNHFAQKRKLFEQSKAAYYKKQGVIPTAKQEEAEFPPLHIELKNLTRLREGR